MPLGLAGLSSRFLGVTLGPNTEPTSLSHPAHEGQGYKEMLAGLSDSNSNNYMTLYVSGPQFPHP